MCKQQYISIAHLRQYQGIDSSCDDALLVEIACRASELIQLYTRTGGEHHPGTARHADCGWAFCACHERRYYTCDQTILEELFLQDGIVEITQITNGDGTIITDGHITQTLYDTNGPWWSICLTQGEWTDKPNPICIEGWFGYSKEPPQDIIHATLRMAAYIYRQKDAQVFDTTAIPEMGIIQIPPGIPSDVREIIARYRNKRNAFVR